ncbi:cyclic-di-AMP receptor [Alkalicoccobacillus murimartini]|uniref:Uncharacterized protein YaaQ n=1 Tax=Alkalicoccobacillus murimartini TaxID=171685 RepID=A0ABT9YK54_9BACI|nr:cyclic-di-AMP receptor [Alkalicoccobacillus murimartini]MDQ0208250.1 uncharacterized protein YaaQ [Alkalicoccobacillus murimartini]
MKLLVCILDDFYKDQVEKELREKGYRMTELASSGGFLRRGSTTFLFGANEDDLPTLRDSLKEACLNVEKTKQRKDKKTHRYTSFLIQSGDLSHLLTNR